MYLFIKEDFVGGPDRQAYTEELVQIAADKYIHEKNLIFAGFSREIARTEKGKPYFKELPLTFSVSHTENLWVCLMTQGCEPVGVDIQQIKETRWERVADRYFTADERELIENSGKDAFFEIWARKEAYAKYTGLGLNRSLADVSTINNKELFFTDFKVRAGIKGACCTEEMGELCIIKI